MPLNLNDLLFKKDGTTGKKELTTGAKIGAGVLAGGAAILIAKIKDKKQQKQTSLGQTEVALNEKTTLANSQSTTPQNPKSNTMLYVGLGVGAVLIIGGILLMSKKKA